MVKSKSSILSNLEKNYGDTKSIAKTVDLSSIENGINPHKLYNKVFKKIDNTPRDYPTEKISVGDIVYVNNNINIQYEVININNKSNIVLRNLDNNEVIETTEKDIKPVMENIDMAKKKLNETQYSVSINGLETTDANALSQMMSAAALADSGSADVGGMDITSTPELPTPETTIETLPQDKTISLDNDANAYANPEMDTAVVATDSIADNTNAVEGEDTITDVNTTLPPEIENPLNNPTVEDDIEVDSSDPFDMDNDGEFDMDTPVEDDIDFDEEIAPTDDEIEVDSEVEEPIDNMEITESQLNESRPDKEDFDNIDENVLQELYEIICDQKGDDYLSDYDEVDYMELIDCVKDFGNDIEGFDESLAEEYANALQEKWKNENTEDGSDDYANYDRPNWEDDEESLDEAYNGTYQTIKQQYLEGSETRDNAISALIDMGEAEDDEEAEAIVDSWSIDDPDYEEPLDENVAEDEEIEEVHQMFLSCKFSDEEILNELLNRGFDKDYANSLIDQWKEEDILFDSEEDNLEEDVLLPKETEDETYNANKALKDKEEEKDEESERISESMDALIKSILENANIKSAQETYAEEITEDDESMDSSDSGSEMVEEEDGLDSEISECLKNAGVKVAPKKHSVKKTVKEATPNPTEPKVTKEVVKEATPNPTEPKVTKEVVEENTTNKPTIVTDESSFANKPNKALKPEDEKSQMKSVDTSTFGADASEGFKEPLNCIKCETVSPKEKIKAIYETAKVRYSKADKSQWNALDRRYITKLIENGCGYTRASKIIFEAKKKK